MISKKICLMGSFAVGKTSLVRRFVESCFDEKYQTTIGVKIDKKVVTVNGKTVQFIIWDFEGRDDFSELKVSYLRGASGYFLVADSTRKDTLDVAIELQSQVEEYLGKKPFLLLLSKNDLTESIRIDNAKITSLENNGWRVIKTSAKTGENVEHAFQQLADKLVTLSEVKAS